MVFAAETGLRTNEWVALERRDLDRPARAVVVQRRYADGVLTPYPKTERSRRRVPLTARALSAVDALPARVDTLLLFSAPQGGHIGLETWGTREWYPALEAAGLDKRVPYAPPPHVRNRGARRRQSQRSSSPVSWGRAWP